jgi:hypothetical protein
MRISNVRRLAAVVGAVALATVAFAGSAATAAPVAPAGVEPPLFTVTAEPLTLLHEFGNYAGTMAVQVRNVGRDPAKETTLRIGIPNGLKFSDTDPSAPCFVWTGQAICQVFDTFLPGEDHVIYLTFYAWAAPAPYARITNTVTLTAEPSAGSGGSTSFAGILGSADGSIDSPRPYEPATVAQTVVTAAGDLTPENPAGSVFTVRVHMSVHAGNDIPNELVRVTIAAPPGSGAPRFDPPSSCFPICEAPGRWMVSGEYRKFDIIFSYRPTTLPVREKVRIDVDMLYRGNVQPETQPAQNRVEVPLVAG